MTTPTDVDLGRAVLALDSLLRAPGPDGAAGLAALVDAIPLALRDQVHAAAADAHRRLDAAAAAGNGTVQALPVGQYPQWVTLDMLATLAGWANGQGSTCTHAPHPARPAHVLAAAWRPGLVVCVRCTVLLNLPPGSARDRTCDGCGRVCAGVDARDPIYSASVAAGPFTYLAGVCTGCRWWPETPDPTRPRPTRSGRRSRRNTR